MTIAKDGDKYTFTDGEGVKYNVEGAGISTKYEGCISIHLSAGINKYEIFVMETGENTITYCSQGKFCVLEKK